MPPLHFVLVFTFLRLAPPATLAVRGRFLTVVCLIIAPAFSFNCSSSRFSWLLNLAVQRCRSGFRGATSSTHVLVSGTGISPKFPYFCICSSSGWASAIVRPWKAGDYPKIRNYSIFVLFGWRFVFGKIMRWEGREPPPIQMSSRLWAKIKLLLSF